MGSQGSDLVSPCSKPALALLSPVFAAKRKSLITDLEEVREEKFFSLAVTQLFVAQAGAAEQTHMMSWLKSSELSWGLKGAAIGQAVCLIPWGSLAANALFFCPPLNMVRSALNVTSSDSLSRGMACTASLQQSEEPTFSAGRPSPGLYQESPAPHAA